MTSRLAPLTGILFCALLIAALFTGTNSLKASSSPEKVFSYYASHRESTRASYVLTLLAVVVGVFFYGLLRDYLRRGEGLQGLTATAFGGVILFAASGAVSAGTLLALSDSPSHLSPAAAQALNLADMDVTSPLAFAGIAVLFVGFGLAIIKSALLPKWLGWIALPLGVLALIPVIGFFAWIGAAIWTLIVSVAMWRRLEHSDTAAASIATASHSV